MEEDDKLFDLLDPNLQSNKNTEIIKKLNEIEFMVRSLLQQRSKEARSNSLCENILEKTYIIVNRRINENTNPNLFILRIDNNNYLITFKDTIELLYFYMKLGDKIEDEIPKRLYPLFSFLKRNGLIYLDRETKEYKLT
ncbi:hypothetical protein DFR85_00680 [Acidianus brierleyi]|nr:hypothetical protein DFR85_00680 [Acidianus brierleyi]